MDRQNSRTNGKSKAIQTKSHKEAYTYTLTKREKGKKKYALDVLNFFLFLVRKTVSAESSDNC